MGLSQERRLRACEHVCIELCVYIFLCVFCVYVFCVSLILAVGQLSESAIIRVGDYPSRRLSESAIRVDAEYGRAERKGRSGREAENVCVCLGGRGGRESAHVKGRGGGGRGEAKNVCGL